MKHLYRLPLSAAVLAMALTVSLPSAVGAKSEGHGKHGRGHSSEARGGHSGKREHSRGEVRYRERRADYRADARMRDSGRHGYAPSHRTRAHYRDDGPSHSNYRPRSYYTGSSHRPRFASRSGFSLGFVIGSVPSYGYRYFDPYCDMGFRNLSVYYDHCYDRRHPDAIQVLDIESGYPIASGVYRGGNWVVDDCY